MQKYKIWIIVALVILCLVTLLLWLSPQDEKQTSNEQDSTQAVMLNPEANALNVSAQNNTFFASSSQQDTEINCQMQLDNSNRLIVNEQTRNCFEYFITQYGEKTIEQIQQDFKTYISQNYKEPALSQILDLWDRYMQYRQSLGEITPPAGLDQEDPAYYRSIYTSTQNLRKRFFSNYEIEGLFGTEDTYHEYTLDRMAVLADKNLSEAEKAQKLKELFQQLPEDWQENLEQLNKLEDLRNLTADIKARGGSTEEIRQMRLNLVGPEATQRLENMDSKRASWKSSVTSYLNERDSIMKSGLNDSAKQKAVQELRAQHFNTPQEQLRVETFEQVHDKGGKLPFAD
ncbi:lipase secretion chaperone [Acinetobacter sp. ASP199]|uniref:lipase secretion chaperone n=1 Tax=unclassified Acinetobacter TaxID=196816 RepID=UPI001F61A558|nr:lipase secretion chaperone [Acinetobacter sp. ASP199]UNT58982.1 lipase secretion chaperone [Acinetobacter sp. ASP199]